MTSQNVASENPIQAVMARLDGGRQWIKGTWCRDGAGVCILGALAEMHDTYEETAEERLLAEIVLEQYGDRLTGRIREAASRGSHVRLVPAFNDHERTVVARGRSATRKGRGPLGRAGALVSAPIDTSVTPPTGAAHCATCICGRRAPVQGDHDRTGREAKPSGTVAWTEHLEAYGPYAARYGRSQSSERLAERGGFSYWEITELLGHEPTTWTARGGR